MKTAVLITCLLAASAQAHTPQAVRPGDRASIPFPGHDTLVLSDETSTPAGAAVLEITVPAGTFGAPPHVHAREDEQFYVIEGEVEFLDRDNTITAGPGTLVVLPRGNLHGFWNLSDQPARMLLIVTPGAFASFFDEVVSAIRAQHPEDPGAVAAIIAAVASEHEVTVHPERIPESAKPVLPN